MSVIQCIFHGKLVEYCDHDECFFVDGPLKGDIWDLDYELGVTTSSRFCPVTKTMETHLFVGLTKEGAEIGTHHRKDDGNHGWKCLDEKQ